jgi:hypothetical protein
MDISTEGTIKSEHDELFDGADSECLRLFKDVDNV